MQLTFVLSPRTAGDRGQGWNRLMTLNRKWILMQSVCVCVCVVCVCVCVSDTEARITLNLQSLHLPLNPPFSSMPYFIHAFYIRPIVLFG